MAKKDEKEGSKDILQEQVQKILGDGSLGEYDKIRALWKLGFSRKQLMEEFHFPKQSVYDAVPVAPDEKPRERTEETKALVKFGMKDMVPPEAALKDIRLQDGEYKIGFIDGMSMLIMAARYNQILAASQAEIIEQQIKVTRETRAEIDAAALRAKEGGAEIAAEAAAGAAAGAMAHADKRFDELRSQLAASAPNPMLSMMMEAMGPLFKQAFGGFGDLMTKFGGKGKAPVGQPPTETTKAAPAEFPPIEDHPISEFKEGSHD